MFRDCRVELRPRGDSDAGTPKMVVRTLRPTPSHPQMSSAERDLPGHRGAMTRD